MDKDFRKAALDYHRLPRPGKLSIEATKRRYPALVEWPLRRMMSESRPDAPGVSLVDGSGPDGPRRQVQGSAAILRR